MATRKPSKTIGKKRSPAIKKTAAKPDHFYVKDLDGEQPPSFETMQRLYETSGELFAFRPWEMLADEELIVYDDAASGQRCYCCLMGRMGEVFSIHAFIGDEGYAAFERMRDEDPSIADTIYAFCRSVYTQLVRRQDLMPPDREVLAAFGHPAKSGLLAPVFRSMRPGYHPWYVTEQEAKLLLDCSRAVIALCGHLIDDPEESYWQDGRYPRVEFDSENRLTGVSLVPPPAPARPVMVQLPKLDEPRIEAIRKKGFPVEGVLEVDHFISAAMIGKPHERKACLGMALCIDAKTAFAYSPQVSASSEPVGELLSNVLLTAIETSRAIPTEVQVRTRERKHLLDRVAKELGFRLRVTESLPAFDFAKEQLLGMLSSK